MLALHLELLTDRYAASRYNDRDRAEWPPHPARVYSALVDALHAAPGPTESERGALDDLAALGAPEILASEAYDRRVMQHFVPVNDANQVSTSTSDARFETLRAKCAKARAALVKADAAAEAPRAKERAFKAREKARARLKKAEDVLHNKIIEAASAASPGGSAKEAPAILPWARGKQPRTFPAAIPHHRTVTFFWPAATAALPIAPLEAVAARIAYVGHSSSMVRLWSEAGFRLADDDPRDRWVPTELGTRVFRVPAPGQRQALEAAHERHRGVHPGRVLPCATARYGLSGAGSELGTTRRTAGRWITYRMVDGIQVPAHAVARLAEVLRHAVIAHAEEPVPPLISGHTGHSASPVQSEHLATLPLPFAVHPHADGVVRGFAFSLPAGVPREVDRALLGALATWESDSRAKAPGLDPRQVLIHTPGGQRSIAERIIDDEDAAWTLRHRRWARPSRRFGTVTPIALDGACDPFNHPRGGLRRKAVKTATKLIRGAVAREIQPPVGVELDPADIGIELVFDAPVRGAAVLRRVPRFQRSGHRHPRRLVHVVLTLPFPVRGPLILGSGRYFGLGLCAPLTDASAP